MASGLYGVLFGIVMVGLTKVVPQPMGAIILWSLICLQLAWGALTCWRRTGLPFASAAMLNGSLMSAGVVTLAFMGQPFPNLAPTSWVLFGCGVAIGAPVPAYRVAGEPGTMDGMGAAHGTQDAMGHSHRTPYS